MALALTACSSTDTTATTTDTLAQHTAPGRPIMDYLHDDTRLVPTKIFDNVYCISSVSVACYAIKTSDGIILIDSMWDDKDAQFIEESLVKLNLNPQDIKYIFLTHGHGDHYGGANYLATKYGAKVLMSEVDNKFMFELNEGPNGPRSPKAKVDIFPTDNYKLTLGDTTLTLLSTPGHTPGCMSAMFNVTENGQKHTVVFWGGTGLPQEVFWQKEYLKSANYFYETATANKADVALTAHLFADGGFDNLDTINSDKEVANPFVKTPEQMDSYLKAIIQNVKNRLAER